MTEARYLYCIAQGNKKITFGKIGIEDKEVYTIRFKNLCAVVHNCPAEPYNSENKEKVKSWIIAHEKVVETAWARFNTVLPLSFDTIIKDDKDGNAEDNIKKWLNDEYAILKQKLNKLRDKAEYGVKIYWDPKIIGEHLAKKEQKIKKLREEIKSKPEGMAYMYKQKLENLIRKQMEKEAESYAKYFYARIKNCVDETKVERAKISEEGKHVLMSLSCLLPKENSRVLGWELAKINNRKAFFVHFTGPWPPYSFV